MSIREIEHLGRVGDAGSSLFSGAGAPSAALSRLERPSGGHSIAPRSGHDSVSTSAPGQGLASSFLDSFASNWGAQAEDRTSTPGAGRPRRRSGRSRRSHRSPSTGRVPSSRRRRSTSGSRRSGRTHASRPTGRTESGHAPKGSFPSRGTGYYPSNSKMEGGFTDRRGHKLNTLQDYLAGKAPFVSVAMDRKMKIPYGTKLRIAELEKKYGRPIEFRVVDTGGAFTGRGTSRIDICTANNRAAHDPTINGPLTLNFGE